MKRMIMAAVCGLAGAVAVPAAARADAVPPADLGGAGAYMPVPAARLDGSTTLGARGTGDVVFAAGQDESTVSASVVAVTVYAPARSGSLVLYPGERARRSTDTTVPFTAGATITRTVVVPKTWRVQLYNSSSARLRVAVDVQGYVRNGSPQTAGSIGTTARVVVADTSRGTGLARRPLAPSVVRSFRVGTVAPLRGREAGAALVEFTVSGARSAGVLTTGTGASGPSSAGAFWFSRSPTTGLALVPLGADGRISVENHAAHPVHLRAVVVGYLRSGPAARPGTVTATRGRLVLRTSQGIGAARRPIAAGHFVDVPVSGRVGIPASAGLVALSLIASHATGTGYVTAADPDERSSGTRSLSYDRSATRSNLVFASIGTNGKVRLWVHGSGRVDLAAVVQGFVARPTMITGTLTGPTGRALPGASVYIRDTNGAYIAYVYADRYGRFVFSPEDPGAYSVCANRIDDDWYPKHLYPTGLAPVCFASADLRGDVAPLEVKAGRTARADLRLRAGAVISGRVTTTGGPTGHVQFSVLGDTYDVESGVDEKGRFTMSGLPPDAYALCFHPFVAPGEAGVVWAETCYKAPAGDYTRTITLGRGETKRNADVILFEGATLRGTLDHEATGVSIRHDEVRVFRDGVRIGRNYPEESGDYVVSNLPPGDVEVCVDPGYTFDIGQCRSVTLVARKTATADFSLVTGARASGRVVDSAGEPISGATVTLTPAGGGPALNDTTSAQGRWALAPFAAGRYTVCASATGYPTRCVGPIGGPPVTVDYQSGSDSSLTLPLGS